jgi:hypothetical protein
MRCRRLEFSVLEWRYFITLPTASSNTLATSILRRNLNMYVCLRWQHVGERIRYENDSKSLSYISWTVAFLPLCSGVGTRTTANLGTVLGNSLTIHELFISSLRRKLKCQLTKQPRNIFSTYVTLAAFYSSHMAPGPYPVI